MGGPLFSEAGNAFVMYGVSGRSFIALGDPVGAPRERQELSWQFRELADRLDLAALSQIASLIPAVTPIVVNHQGQFPVVTVSFNLAPNVSLGEAVEAIVASAAIRAAVKVV